MTLGRDTAHCIPNGIEIIDSQAVNALLHISPLHGDSGNTGLAQHREHLRRDAGVGDDGQSIHAHANKALNELELAASAVLGLHGNAAVSLLPGCADNGVIDAVILVIVTPQYETSDDAAAAVFQRACALVWHIAKRPDTISENIVC